MRNCVLALALLAPASLAFASTDCISEFVQVTLQVPGPKPTYLVEFNGGVKFLLSPDVKGYREFSGLTKGVSAVGERSVARFAANDINCKSLVTRTDLIALRIPDDVTLVTSTSPPPPPGTPTISAHDPLPAGSPSVPPLAEPARR